jgi:acyl-CoA synthetase (NDP forming)
MFGFRQEEAGQVGERVGVTSAPGRALIEDALKRGATSLDERVGKQLFAEYGVAVPQGADVSSADEAVLAARRLGYPVVMKGSSPTIQHKTDAGLVILSISDEAEVRAAYRTLETRAAAAGAELSGVLVERMVRGKREFVVGLMRDRLFGPVVMFGLGGIFAEVLGDVAFAVAPLTEADAEELLDQIKAKALLGSFRGSPAVGREALVAVLLAVGQMAIDHPEIREIDVNPLVIDDDGKPVAVDALVAIGEPIEPSTRGPADLSQLHALVAPRHVAVVGASADTGKWGGMLVANLRLGGFPGPIYLVNPKGGTILGLPVFRSVAELPEPPDLVIVAVAAAQVKDTVEACGQKGVSAVVVVSAGFSELGAEGRRLEDEVVATAEKYGMALVGPNCMGVISAHHNLYATGFMLLRPEPGGASMVSQSGNLGTQLLVSAEQRKGGVGKFIGVGNEAMIDAVDFINYLHTDPETNTIVAYMEGFDDGRRLLEVVRRTSLDKPVLVLRGGTSNYGQRAAASHTGALASSAAVFDAAARQSGMIVSTDPDEFMDLTFALSYMPLPPGTRVAVATLGGGWGVLVSDEIARCGLELAELPGHVIEELDKLLPPFWSHSNPVDLVATVTPGVPEAVLRSLVSSDAVDAIVVMGVVGSMSESRRAIEEIEALKARHGQAEGVTQSCADDQAGIELSPRELQFIAQVAELMDRYRKPIMNISFKPMRQAVFASGGRYSTIVLPSPLRAVRALAKMAKYGAYLQRHGRGGTM